MVTQSSVQTEANATLDRPNGSPSEISANANATLSWFGQVQRLWRGFVPFSWEGKRNGYPEVPGFD